ncbi:conserved exported hypothetical protein [Gammaproteobacteria bacterium]
MKSKFIFIFFTTALFSSISVFAADSDVIAKKSVSKKSVGSLTARANALEDQVRILKSQIGQMQGKDDKVKKEVSVISDDSPFQTHSLLEMYAHGPAVVTSPAFGVRRPDDNYSNLMSRLPSMNEDLVLLGLRQKMDNYANEKGIPIPSRPIIALSGGVEGQVAFNSNDGYTSTSKSDINLSMAEIDVIAEAGSWATAAMIINYEDKKDTASVDSVTRWNNSRIRLDRGWVTFGQLNKAPAYFTIGQVFAPFGNYSSNMVTTPSTQILGRVKDRMVVLGYNQFGVYGQAYTYAGETKPTSSEIIKHCGFNLGYRFDHENFAMDVGAGVLGNLAESQGMQQNIFGLSSTYPSPNTNFKGGETIVSRVYGLNGHAKATFYDMVTLIAEYVGASKSFDPIDLTFNGHGAKPQALNIEGSAAFKVMGKPSTVFAGYGMTSQALALGVPKESFFAGCTMNIVKYTLASLEYRHDIGYGSDSSSSSPISGTSSKDRFVSYNSFASSAGAATVPAPARRHNNKVTAVIGVYF